MDPFLPPFPPEEEMAAPPPIDPAMAMADPMAPIPGPGAMAVPPLELPPVEDAEMDEPFMLGPRMPTWYRKPPKPKLEEVLEQARREKDDHQLRLERAAEMIRRLNCETVGFFERDREAIEAGEIETFHISALRDEHDAACAWISSMDLTFQAKGRDSFDREEVSSIEDYLHLVYERWSESHSDQGNGPLEWAKPDVVQKYGMIAAYVGVNPDDGQTGVETRLLDPATVFPIYEGARGLSAVYRVYNAPMAQVIGDFGDDDGAVERKVRKVAKTGGGEEQHDRHIEMEVVEYWDRNWGMVSWGGEMIRTWEHGYGTPPFVIRFACFGMQGFTRTPDPDFSLTATEAIRGGAVFNSDRSLDLARQAQPFLWRRIRVHDIEEAIAGRLVTAMRRSMNPPLVAKQGILSAGEGDPEIDPTEGGVTKIRDDDAIEALPNLPAPEIMTPLMNVIQQNRQTGMAPGLLMGQNPAAQTSGSALDILSQGGFEKWSPIVLCIEAFDAAVASRCLEIVRDWGEVLGEEEDRGVLVVPRRNPALTPGDVSSDHLLKPEVVRRVGIRVKATMSKFNPLSLGNVANSLVMAKSMNAIDQRSVIRMLGYTTDIEGTIRKIDEDLLDDVPEIKQAKTLEILKRQADRAMAVGDEESAREILLKARYVAEQMQIAMMQKMQQMGGMLGMGGDPSMQGQPPMPGVPQPTTPPPDPNATNINYQGASLPDFGIQPGTEGGRPPMPPGQAVG